MAPFAPGEQVHLCAEPATSSLEIVIRHAESRTVIYRLSVASLADCPA